MTKIVICGLYYESNLGDPLLFDCIIHLLKHSHSMNNNTLDIIDILGREGVNYENCNHGRIIQFKSGRTATLRLHSKTNQESDCSRQYAIRINNGGV